MYLSLGLCVSLSLSVSRSCVSFSQCLLCLQLVCMCAHMCVRMCKCLTVTHTESGWQVVAPHPSEHQALTLLHRNTHTSLSPSILTLCAVQTASHMQIRHTPPSLCSVRCPPGGSEHGEGALVSSRQGPCLSLSSVHVPNRIPLAEVLGVFCCKG